VNAIPDKFAQWDVAYVLRRAVSSRTPGARGASGQLSHLPAGRLGTCCPPRSAGSGLASGCGDAVFSGRRSGSAFPQPSLFLIAMSASFRGIRPSIRPGAVQSASESFRRS
jgi:hypothetical protein